MEVIRHIRSTFRPISHQKIESTICHKWFSSHCCDDYTSLAYNEMWLYPCNFYLLISALPVRPDIQTKQELTSVGQPFWVIVWLPWSLGHPFYILAMNPRSCHSFSLDMVAIPKIFHSPPPLFQLVTLIPTWAKSNVPGMIHQHVEKRTVLSFILYSFLPQRKPLITLVTQFVWAATSSPTHRQVLSWKKIQILIFLLHFLK